jgi:UDP-3-O-[3-hydroxymyristoyl] glucosamine N-acyltransferase
MQKYSVKDIVKYINEPYEIIGDPLEKYVTHVKSVAEADVNSLTWIRPDHRQKQHFLENTKAKILVCDNSLKINDEIIKDKVLIVVKNPKFVFIKIVEALFVEKLEFGIHPTAVIHSEAQIAADTYIGPFTYVGKSKIREGTIIYGSTYIYDNVKIGKNVIIEAGCIIGSAGYNFARDEKGKLHKFPHLGGVIIEDDVEIQASSVVDRGVLDDTVIGKGTKIDSLCYIAHNCKIGKDNLIIGHSMLSGSVTLGDKCWVSPSVTFRDDIRVGHESFIGMGSLVVNNLDDKSYVMGAFHNFAVKKGEDK